MLRSRFFPAHSIHLFHTFDQTVGLNDLFTGQLIFVWDALMDPEAVAQLLGRNVPFGPACLRGYGRTAVRKGGEWQFALKEDEDGITPGVVLIGLSEADLEKIDQFEQAPLLTARHKLKIRIGDLERVAGVYLRSGSYLED